MNANRQSAHDESDEALDRMIRAAYEQLPPVEIRQRVIERAAAFTPRIHTRWWPARARPWLLCGSIAATVAAACVITLLLLPSPSIGWEDVAQAVQAQPWIRETSVSERGEFTTWLSPERQVWAFRRDKEWFIFMDGRQQAKYEYRSSKKQIVKMAMSEEDKQLFSSVDYASQAPWMFGNDRVLSQTRREVKEGGKRWTEFDLIFSLGGKHGTLRVDPQTKLPVHLALKFGPGQTQSMKYDFTYPKDGPLDIYTLGVPAGTLVDDRMPAKDVMAVLNTIAASRARIGDFRLVVAATPGQGFSFRQRSFIVWRKGDRWRIDQCVPETQVGAAAQPPDGLGWPEPVKTLKLSWLGPLYMCDSQKVYENAGLPRQQFENGPLGQAKPVTWQPAAPIAPHDLLSGKGLGMMGLALHANFASMVYPDLSPVAGWGFEFDPQPAAMPGCVLVKRTIEVTTREPLLAHEWYYLDPTKGYAVVLAELFNLPPKAPADPKSNPDRQTIRMEEFKQSPQGFWYPSVIHDTIGLGPNQAARRQAASRTTTVHYYFDFSVTVADELFEMKTEGRSEK